MAVTSQDYREEFLSILNNRGKTREQGFVVFVHGAVDLAPMEELCFSPEQTYNQCLTARYGAGQGNVLYPLIRQFRNDAQYYLTGISSKIQFQSIQPDSTQSPVVGIFRPVPPEGTWDRILQNLKSMGGDGQDVNLDHFFSIVRSAFKVGDRLVLFCELSDIPADATLNDIGFYEDFVKQLITQLPERLGLVISGLPTGLDMSILGDRFLGIEVGPEYGARGTPLKHPLPLRNDTPRGEDQLQIASEVNALADAIVGKDMEPPLVVGILGGWGAGKSFILHLLQERLRFIRNRDLSDDNARDSSPYVGHPYLVRFDAWTYAKSDLWASLMERILINLDQQLDLEKSVGPEIVKKGFDLWEIIANSSKGQLEALQKNLGKKVVGRIKNWKQGKDTAKALWEALKILRKDELKQLEDAREELEKKQKEGAEALQKVQIESEQIVIQKMQEFEKTLSAERQKYQNELDKKQAELAAAQARIVAKVDEDIERLARKEAWEPVFGELESFFGAVADRALKIKVAESDGAPVSIWMVAKEIGLGAKYLTGLWKSPGSVLFLAIALVSGILTWYFAQIQIESLFATLAGSGTLIGALTSLYKALTTTNRWLEEKQSVYEDKMKRSREDKASLRESRLSEEKETQIVPIETEIKSIQDQLVLDVKVIEESQREDLKILQLNEQKTLEEKKTAYEGQIQELKEKVEEHARRAGIPGQSKSLTDLIQKRIESGYYHERLGILHQVQTDLQEITEALLPVPRHDEKTFPRGAPRIILFVDDLDRCPPDKVVQVLEAAQLLVKTRFFVVVIAMDVRYVTRALEKEYQGILVHEGNPSGLDYAEKIVQIPYRVRPISESAMTTYLQSQMVIRQVEEQFTGTSSLDRAIAQAIITAPGQATTRVNETLPPEIQEFELEELEMMRNAAVAVEISPRATKRLVNVMKLIKNIWYRKGISVPGADVKKAMILLLSLSASYPEAMARVLDQLERDFLDSLASHPIRELRTTLQGIIDRWSKLEGIPADWDSIARLIQKQTLLDVSLTLNDLTMENLQLVRSFSFLGEVEMPLVAKTQKHTVELLSESDKAASLVKGKRRSSSGKSGTGI